MNWPFCPVCTACDGTTTALVSSESVSATCTNCPGHKASSLVRKCRLELNRAGRLVHGVVNEGQFALRRRHVHVFKRRRHFQRVGAVYLLLDFRQILLRHGERDVNRMNLVDGQQHVVRRLDDIARVSIRLPVRAVNRRADLAIIQIQQRIGDGRPVRRHRAGQGVKTRPVRVQFILGNQFLIEQFLFARQN